MADIITVTQPTILGRLRTLLLRTLMGRQDPGTDAVPALCPIPLKSDEISLRPCRLDSVAAEVR